MKVLDYGPSVVVSFARKSDQTRPKAIVKQEYDLHTPIIYLYHDEAILLSGFEVLWNKVVVYTGEFYNHELSIIVKDWELMSHIDYPVDIELTFDKLIREVVDLEIHNKCAEKHFHIAQAYGSLAKWVDG